MLYIYTFICYNYIVRWKRSLIERKENEMKENEMKEKLLELIETQTDTYSYREILDNNFRVSELAEILATLIKYNESEEE